MSGVADTHFVQQTGGPVFVGTGSAALLCSCGNELIRGYDRARFLAVGIRCERCAALTTTPPLPAGSAPPFAVVIAEPVAEVRTATITLPASTFVIGRAEMDRITALYQPVTPPDTVYRITPDLLARAACLHDQHMGAALPAVTLDSADPFEGSTVHALAWAEKHLAGRLTQASWNTRDSAATSAAATILCGFVHFTRTWGHHPLFPSMVATAAARGFSLHDLAPFAAAHGMTTQGNRIGFPLPCGSPGRIERFVVATGPTESVAVHTAVFDRFEYPYGRPWNAASLRPAVAEAVSAAQARINLKNPGLLLLSPGIALAGFDEALIEAVKAVMQTEGRRNRGLMAVAPLVLRMQALPDPHALRYGYGLFPIANRHYAGDSLLRITA